MRASSLLVSLLLMSLPALANNESVEAFNDAWQAYLSVAESDDAALIVQKAAYALESGRVVFSEGDEELAVLTHTYGAALLADGNREKASSYLKEALRLGEAFYGTGDAGLIPILADLADSQASPRAPRSQVLIYWLALEIAREQFGKTSLQYADLAFRAAEKTFSLSESVVGYEFMKEAHAIYTDLPGQNTQSAALADYYVGRMAFSVGDLKLSTEHLERALTGFEKTGSENDALRLLARTLLVQGYEYRGLSEAATEHCIAIGRERAQAANSEYAPIYRATPVFPNAMRKAGRFGHLDIRVTVDEQGFVRDPVIVSRTIHGMEDPGFSGFDNAALRAVRSFRYAPRFVDGKAVVTKNVTARVPFDVD